MIKFTAVNKNGNTHNIATLHNRYVAAHLNKDFENKNCPDHPNGESIFLVDTTNNDGLLTPDRVCCNQVTEFLYQELSAIGTDSPE